jgi:aspartokinase
VLRAVEAVGAGHDDFAGLADIGGQCRRHRGVRHIATARPGDVPVVVVSAMSGVTDRLLALASAAERHDEAAVASGIDELWARHAEVTAALTSGSRRDTLLAALRAEFDDLRALLKAASILRSATPATLDAVRVGRRAAQQPHRRAAFEEAGVPAAWIDARRVIVTDDNHTAAAPLAEDTRAPSRAGDHRRPAPTASSAVRRRDAAAVTTTLGAAGRTIPPRSSAPRWRPPRFRSGRTWTAS